MERILGIDTGTNSLGWAIIEKDGDTRRLLYKGTNIFSEGVKIEKGIESSKAADRTDHRSVRKHYWRRKVRKVRLLTILSENRLCPPLDKEELREWKLKRIYPKSDEFMEWQRTEDKDDINPYRYRYLCLTEKLDLTDIRQRYILGRALYHLNQRRGFLSNRKETTKSSCKIRSSKDLSHIRHSRRNCRRRRMAWKAFRRFVRRRGSRTGRKPQLKPSTGRPAPFSRGIEPPRPCKTIGSTTSCPPCSSARKATAHGICQTIRRKRPSARPPDFFPSVPADLSRDSSPKSHSASTRR